MNYFKDYSLFKVVPAKLPKHEYMKVSTYPHYNKIIVQKDFLPGSSLRDLS